MSLADEHAALGAEQLIEFYGETVTSRPAGVGAVAREILALVWRDAPGPVPGAPVPAPVSRIWIRNDASAGETSIDRGAHRFDVADVYGGEATTRQVVRAVGDAGGWMITLR